MSHRCRSMSRVTMDTRLWEVLARFEVSRPLKQNNTKPEKQKKMTKKKRKINLKKVQIPRKNYNENQICFICQVNAIHLHRLFVFPGNFGFHVLLLGWCRLSEMPSTFPACKNIRIHLLVFSGLITFSSYVNSCSFVHLIIEWCPSILCLCVGCVRRINSVLAWTRPVSLLVAQGTWTHVDCKNSNTIRTLFANTTMFCFVLFSF